MDIFGIGPAELFFVILIAIIILGPKDMQKAGRTIGRFLNQLVRSDSWKIFQKTSAEIRDLPRNLMREANLEEANKEIAEAGNELQRTLDPRMLDPLSNPPESASDPTPSVPPSDEAESATPAEPPTVEPAEDQTDNNG